MRSLRDIFQSLKILFSTWQGSFNFIVGLFWVGLYLFMRFFYTFTGYLLVELRDSVSFFTLFFFFSIVVLINFFILISYPIEWYKKKYNKATSPLVCFIVQKYSLITSIFIWTPLNTVYKVFERDIPGSGRFFLFLEKYFFLSAWRRDTPYRKGYLSYIFILLFSILPRLCLALIFFIEVVFFSQVIYFIYFLPVLILPVLFKITLKIMKTFAFSCTSEVANRYFLTVVTSGKQKLVYGIFTIHQTYTIAVKPQFVSKIDPLGEHRFLLQLQNIAMQVYYITREDVRWTDVVIITTSLLYFTAGVIRLYIICF